MKLLAVETSCYRASAAVFDGDACLAELVAEEGKKHAGTILPLIERTLAAAGTALSEIGLFAVCVGPGSFTGVRIGVSAVNAMAYAAGRPVAPVDALYALYEGAKPVSGRVCAVIDAGGGRAYAAVYADGETLLPPSAVELDAFLREHGEGVPVVGDAGCAEKQYPSARLVGMAALPLPGTERAVPLYVRPSQAERARKKDEA